MAVRVAGVPGANEMVEIGRQGTHWPFSPLAVWHVRVRMGGFSMGYFGFLRKNRRAASFGFGTALFSSFGQTFFISLFVPAILLELSVGAGAFGAIYSLATLGSALLLPYLGALYDKTPLRLYVTCVVAGLGAASLLFGLVGNLVFLVVALFGLRLCGQGLISHVSVTTMAKLFPKDRGKALGVASLGFPAGEGILPPLAAVLVLWIGWRETWLVAGAFCLLVLLPLFRWLAPSGGDPVFSKDGDRKPKPAWWLLRDWKFLLIMPAFLALPFVTTGIFLYQLQMGEARGWRPELIASSFVVFALARGGFALLSGPWVDRIGALRLMPVCSLPLAVGLIFLLVFSGKWVAPVYLFSFGIAYGLAGGIKTAVWAELYGTEHLGAIRGLLATLGTLSTAASPVLFGVLLDNGVSFQALLAGSLAVVLASLPTLIIVVRRESAKMRSEPRS